MKKYPSKKATEPIVVGIGASAGGLEALQEFFKAVPLDTGLVFVVIQHLSPDYKSLMDELLARHTKLKIVVIEDGMSIEPDTVFLIPPRKDLSLSKNRLVLRDQSLKKGLHLPVDVFFCSLAEERGKSAIGIILSGTGSDGTLGTRAIKEAGGMIMAQSEASAKFDGMPRSSIATGLVDFVLAPVQMPEALVTYVSHPFVKKSRTLEDTLAENEGPLARITLILRESTGIDFSHYKENTLIRRLERRVSINRFDTLDEYLTYLQDSEKERETLFRELLIGVTRFFRDPEAFVSLSTKVFPQFAGKKTLRVWSAGCSTGEEVYSLAILLLDWMEKHNRDCEVKLFATDLDRQALETAGRGFYPDSVAADVDPAFLSRYFHKREGGYQINEAVRRMVVFAPHNILKDPPFSKLDLLVCRNLFIYFKPEVQSRLFGAFYHSVAPEGFLFLGSSESLGTLGDGFETIDAKNKIYKQRAGFLVPLEKVLPTLPLPLGDPDGRSLIRTRDALRWDKLTAQVLSRFLPPSVLIDANDQIVQTVNDTSRFLKIQPGRFSANLFDHLPQELGLLVSSLLRRLRRDETEVHLEGLAGLPGFQNGLLEIEGHALKTDRASYCLLCFRTATAEQLQVPPPAPSQDMGELYLGRVGDLERELQLTRESLQATVEELETSNEELQSSNEELVASNEELQSTNEELQSVNEELYSVNAEYQNKIEELTNLHNDEVNLLRNTGVGALYLDRNLTIRKSTPKISEITRILPEDQGRPFDHISALPSCPDLIVDLKAVLETLVPRDREVTGIDGLVYLCQIRPYRDEFNAVDGLLITLIDITRLRAEQNRTDQALRRLGEALQRGHMAWWEWDVPTGWVDFDPRKATMLGYTVEEFPRDVFKICELIHPEDYQATMKAMEDHLAGRSEAWDVAYRIRCKDGTYAVYYDQGAVTSRDEGGRPVKVVGTVVRAPGVSPWGS